MLALKVGNCPCPLVSHCAGVLWQTAAQFVSHLIDAMWLYQQGDGDESSAVIDHVVGKMAERYSKGPRLLGRAVKRETIVADLNRVFGTLMKIADGACPAEAGLDSREIRYGKWLAPARMDLAVTYRCNLKCGKCYVGERAVGPELATTEWIDIFGRLWAAGTPQIVFTGGEPTLRDDIVDLVSEADEFVTGLVTNGTRLAELAAALRGASLDYVQVTVESFDPRIHDRITCAEGSHARTAAGIEKALGAGLAVVTNTTLTRANAASFGETVRWLHGLGVRIVACNTLICSGHGVEYRKEQGLDGASLGGVLAAARRTAEELGVALQWYSPTCWHQGMNPVELGLGVKTCSAASHNMTIQPDGTVLPCQSWSDAVGNILKDEWAAIWRHPTCVKLRERRLLPARCRGCEYESACGGACPLDPSPRTARREEKGAAV